MGKSYAQKVKAKQNRSTKTKQSRNASTRNEKERSDKFPIAPVVVVGIVIILIIASIVLYQVQNNDGKDNDQDSGNNGVNNDDQSGDLPLHSYVGLESINKGSISLEQYLGKVVIIDMFATWCGPCADQMDELLTLQNIFSNHELVILSVDTDLGETRADVIEFMGEYPEARWTFAVSNQRFNSYFPASSIPTLYILDKNLEIAHTEVGVTSSNSLEEKVSILL